MATANWQHQHNLLLKGKAGTSMGTMVGTLAAGVSTPSPSQHPESAPRFESALHNHHQKISFFLGLVWCCEAKPQLPKSAPRVSTPTESQHPQSARSAPPVSTVSTPSQHAQM